MARRRAAAIAAVAVDEETEIYRRIRNNAFDMPDREFLLQYRMRKEDVHVLSELLRPLLEKERTTKYVIGVEQEVLATLLFYGSGSFQRVVASNYENGMSQPTVSRTIERVTNAIITTLRHLISFPVDNGIIQSTKV